MYLDRPYKWQFSPCPPFDQFAGSNRHIGLYAMSKGQTLENVTVPIFSNIMQPTYIVKGVLLYKNLDAVVFWLPDWSQLCSQDRPTSPGQSKQYLMIE